MNDYESYLIGLLKRIVARVEELDNPCDEGIASYDDVIEEAREAITDFEEATPDLNDSP